MVKLYTIKTLAPGKDDGPSSPTRSGVPNRFRSRSYDRSVFGTDDCTKFSGNCSCSMCCVSPYVILPSGEPICDQYNITLRNVQELVDGGLMKHLHEDAFLIYYQCTDDGNSQLGLFAAIDIDDCINNTIKKHENVTHSTGSLRGSKKLYVDPVMLMYRDNTTVASIIERIVCTEAPFQKMECNNGNHCQAAHALWTVNDLADIRALQEAFDGVENMYIADGHHRVDAASRDRMKLLNGGSSVNIPASSRYLTAVLFPDTQMNILPYNRCLRSSSLKSTDLLEQLFRAFDVRPCAPRLEEYINTPDSPVSVAERGSGSCSTVEPSTPGSLSLSSMCELSSLCHTCSWTTITNEECATTCCGSSDISSVRSLQPLNPSLLSRARRRGSSTCSTSSSGFSVETSESLSAGMVQVYCDHRWYEFNLQPPTSSCPLAEVDSQQLREQLLGPVFNVSAQGGNDLLYVDGREGAAGIEKQVDSGAAVAGFLLRAVSPDQVMRVADAGLVLPAKATFFDPKPLPNILMRLIR